MPRLICGVSFEKFHRLFLVLVLGLAAGGVRADTTYFPLSTGDFSQAWTNIGLITANDDWAGVPGIVGYLGQDITTATGADPQTLLGTSAVANDVDVIANQTNTGITNGGVAEFQIANPTIALQGSGTADAPHLILHLNTTGRSNIVVSYTLRDIDGTADNAVQAVALQYRVGTSGNFVNLPAGFVGDATTGPSLATAVTNVSVTLPAAAEDQAQVQVRIITTNAASNDEWVGIDDISVTSSGGGGVIAPSITTHPSPQTVAVGGTATFSVVAGGSEPLSYQWQKGGSDVTAPNASGVNSPTLTLTNVQTGDVGNYAVVVTNSASTITSNSAALTVDVPVAPGITTHPSPQTVNVGGTATFFVVASGSEPLSYQWQKGGVDVTAPNATGATTATLTLANVQLADVGSYAVVVTNSVSTITSDPATLTVNTVDLYWDLHLSNFSQNWSATGLITANDNWAAVPSIIGYLGQDLTSATGTNPATILGPSSALNDIDVIANQSNPNTLASGGVAEFDSLANPSIALQGSGTADAPHVVLHLNTSGRTAVTIAYKLRDLDGSADDAAQPVALQYRIGESGDFVDVPEAFVADATSGPGLATLETPVSVVLPAAVDNQPKVQVRIITSNAVGNDEWVGVDDISVTSAHDNTPRIFVTQTNGSTAVAEAGLTIDTYHLRLNTTPLGAVTVRATADAQTLVSADGLTFGATADVVISDTTPRTITVRAADDAINEAATHFSLVAHTIVASTDPAYPTSFTIPALTVSVADDDGGTGVTRIHFIQGSGDVSPLASFAVTINGVVTGFFLNSTGGRDGFYVQEEDANADADPTTSEGIYVFAGSSSPHAATIASLAVGDVVTVTGRATEFNALTEVDTLTDVTKTGVASLPAAVSITLPLGSTTFYERYEGMRVTLPQTLSVTDNFDLGHFGQIVLSNGRLPQPTNIVAPGAPAQAQAAANLLNQIVLDDGTSRSYPDPTPYVFDDGSGATLRAGDTTTSLTGVLTYQFGLYMLEPATPPIFTRGNPRSAAPPAVGGALRVAIGNVLNLFNGDGAGGGFPTARGATDPAEYQRQLAKIVAGIIAVAPDIMGLTEVENDGYGPASALADLTHALNAAAPAGTTYAYVDASAVDIVTDLIHSSFIYRTETVELVGAPAMLSSPYFNNHARNPLAQTFREKATGGKFTASINHFRAKASVSSMSDGIVPNPNNDQGDGQGSNNYLRTKESEALVQWLATDPTDSGDPDFLILGDLNAYAKEDPITALENAGYINLTEHFEGVGGYSYSFDGAFGHLDHALASTTLAPQVTGAATWHLNSDEPIYYDYNTENKSAAQQAINVGTSYRYSDHDPVVIGVNLNAAPTITTQPASQTTTVGTSVTFSIAAGGVPAPTYQWRKGTQPIGGATGASYTLASPVTADAGSYDVVVTNGVGSVTSAPATLIVNKAVAGVTLTNLIQTYNGSPHAVTVTTAPTGLNFVATYDGSATVPTNAGSYAVAVEVADADYAGSATGTLSIMKAPATITLGSLSATYDGTPKTASATTLPAGLNVTFTYDGSASAPTNAGSYAVIATVNNANYFGAAAGTLVIGQANATVTLGNLIQRYDGTPKPVTVTTAPANLNVVTTYNGSATPPTYPGAYAVVATINDASHAGATSDTLVITLATIVRHAPTLNGGIDGSLQVLLPENVTLNGNAWISGDLLMPGTPAVQLNGHPTFAGIRDGPGNPSPTSHRVTLNGNAVLRHLVRRIDATAMPVVSAPPAPAGTRNVSLNNAGQSAGNFATLRNLTLNGNVGQIAVPAGTYGTFTANGNSGFVFGVPGATTPSIYNLQGLTLNGNSRLQVVGPVTLNLANGIAINGTIGTTGHPEWLTLNVASGGVTLNGNVALHGSVVAPSGTITVNGNSTLNGAVASDRLIINGNGQINSPGP